MQMPSFGNAAFSRFASRTDPWYSQSCFSASPRQGLIGSDMAEIAQPHGVMIFASSTYLSFRRPSNLQFRIFSCLLPSSAITRSPRSFAVSKYLPLTG